MQDPGAAGCFRRTRQRTNTLLGSVALIASVAVFGPTSAPATTAAASDIDVSIALPPGRTAVAGVPFSLNVGMGNAGPDSASARLIVELPPGLESTLANRIGCPTGTGTLDCGRQELAAGESTDDVLKAIAAKPGTYTVVVRGIDVIPSDSNAPNNTASYKAVVSAAAVTPTVRAFRVSPAKPSAGSVVTASFAVVDSATKRPIVPSGTSCVAVAGGTKLRSVGSVSRGRATCRVFTPISAKGKVLHGSVGATASGKRLRKTFTVLLR